MNKLTNDKFILKANKIHNNTYNYSMCCYTSSKEKVKILCKKHGVFQQAADKHLSGRGCKECGAEKRIAQRTYTVSEFVERAKKKHGNKYDYSKVVYIGINQYTTIICKKHGEFNQKPRMHLNGRGCKRCKSEAISASNSAEKHYRWNSNREEIKLKKKIRCTCKTLIRDLLKKIGKVKKESTADLLGYSSKELYEHLSKHSNWNKVKNEKWHIDHIFPINAFIKYGITDLKIINALENLQPLLVQDNLSKGDRFNAVQFISKYKQHLRQEVLNHTI